MVPCQPRQLMGWAGAIGAGTRVLGGLGVACGTLEGTWVWASLLERGDLPKAGSRSPGPPERAEVRLRALAPPSCQPAEVHCGGSLARPGPHPTEAECWAGSLLQVATATPALGFPDLDSGAFVFQPFPVHHRLTPAA